MYKQVIELIKGKKTFLIASHINPDGDGIGSTIALGAALRKLGKNVVMYNGDPVPANLRFLPNSSDVVSAFAEKAFDVVILVDCSSISRASIKPEVSGVKLIIDHHQKEDSSSDFYCVDEKAASSGEVALKLIKKLGVPVTSDIASCIYCSLVVDTGFFRFSNTTEHVLRLAADLVSLGADPWTISRELEENYPSARLYLMAMSLASLKITEDGRYASMDITQKMLNEAKASAEISDEFASIPRTIDTVEVSALFRELKDGRVKVSFRSKGKVDVAELARTFGGGGHAYAAGCVLKNNIDEAKDKIRLAVEKALEK